MTKVEATLYVTSKGKEFALVILEKRENLWIIPVELPRNNGLGIPWERLGTFGKKEEKEKLLEKVKERLEKSS